MMGARTSSVSVAKTVTVANAGTDSGAAEIPLGKTLCGVFIPTGLEGTTLAFSTSETLAGTYVPVRTAAGALSITVVAATAQYVALDPNVFRGLRFIKLVVAAQTGAIIFTLACE